MSHARPRDPLLTGTRWLLRIAMAGMTFAIAVAAAAVGGLLAFPDKVAPRLADAPPGTLWWAIVAVMIVIAILALSIRFTVDLSRIVATVGHDDPFQPENADRLDRMAWVSLIVQLCGFVLAPVVGQIAAYIGEGRNDYAVSFSGFVLTLVLFILARVFRHGAAMRADLEGTV
ncbi:DUF2975 domain-containing protein [Sphingomonas koreensis]